MKSLASCLRPTAALLAALSCIGTASADVVKSTPVGVVSRTLQTGSSGLALPLIVDDVFIGVVESNTTGALAFNAASGNVGGLLTAGRSYYVEVIAGPLVGERFDLDTAATITAAGPSAVLNLTASSNSTLRVIAVDALIGARCALRPHVTLADLQTLFTPGLVGSDQFGLADGVRIFNGTMGLQLFYLRADGVTWNTPGSPTDQRTRVIPPDVSVQVELKSGAKQWVHLGGVRTNAFRKNFYRGTQSFASGFPVDLTPVQLRAFVDLNAPATSRWTGADVLNQADQIDVRFSASGQAGLYYLRADGQTWTKSAGPVQDVSGQSIVGATDLILIKRNKADAQYSVPVPYSL